MTLHTHPKHPFGHRDVWFYEDEKGFDIYVEFRAEHSRELLNKVHFRILWRDIEGAVRRRSATTNSHDEDGS